MHRTSLAHHQVEDRCVGLELLLLAASSYSPPGDEADVLFTDLSVAFFVEIEMSPVSCGRRNTYGYNHTETACSSHGGSCSTGSKEYRQLVHL
jgi:hypothetical protein